MSKRLVIDQKLCRKVKIMLDGGAKHKEIAELLGIGVSTIGRIRDAGFDAEVYQQNVEGRRKQETTTQAEAWVRWRGLKDNEKPEDEQVPGQMRMFMPEGGGTQVPLIDENKMMRFLAGEFKDTDEVIQITIGELILHVGKIEDYLAQILRRMDK